MIFDVRAGFGKNPPTKKDLEKDRYLQAQLHLLESKLQRLERIFSVGMPLSEAEESIERMDKIEKDIKIANSKIDMFASVMKDVKEDQAKALEGLDSKAGINQLQIISQRIKFLENIYGELSSGRTKNIFMNIVEILRSLETRIKTLETIANRNVRLMFSEELSNVKSQAAEEGTAGGSLLQRAAESPEMMGPESGAGAGGKRGASGKVKWFFRRLLGRD